MVKLLVQLNLPTKSGLLMGFHQLTYCQLQATVSVFNYSFFLRVIKVWNLLPYGVTSSSTLSCFKQSALPAIRSETKVPSHLHRL